MSLWDINGDYDERLLRMALVAAIASAAVPSPTVAVEADATRGHHVFAACAACHSLEPNRIMTGPSLWRCFGTAAREA